LTGYGVKKRRITTSLMEEAIKDLTRTPFVPSGAPQNQSATHKIRRRHRETTGLLPRRWSIAAGLALMAVIIFGLGLILGNPDLGWRENLTRLSQRVFPSQKTSQGGGAGGISTTTELGGKDIQAKLNQAIDAARVPTEKVEVEPVPAGEARDASAPSEAVKAAGVSMEKDEAGPVPAGMTKKDAPAPTVAVKAADGPQEKAEAEPVPPLEVPTAPLEVATGSATAEEAEAASLLAEKLETSPVSAGDVVAPGVPGDKFGPISTAAAPQTNVLPQSVGATEEIKKEDATIAQEETTEDSAGSPMLESPDEELQLALSIRPGDTLTAIIIQHYGAYNKETLRAVLHENPEIQDPDLIIAGKILKLPLPSEKP
jgi:hypothetical protein